jgi:ribosomal protein L37AE/L43A
MAASALTMSNSLPPANRQRGFTRRLFALLFFVAGIVFWMYFIYQTQRTMANDLMMAFGIVMIALAAGIGARFLYYERNWFVRLITAWASFILGLFLLGFITNWKMGFGPIEFWRTTFDWMEIAQLGGGMLIVLLALTAWWHGPASSPTVHKEVQRKTRSASKRPAEQRPVERVVERPRERVREPTPVVVPRTTSQSSGFSIFGSRRVSEPKKAPVRLKVSGRGRALTRPRSQTEKVVVGRLTKTVRPARSRKLFQRKREMQISTHEEHRCPFCLEDVKRNDPRGVKECSICHTLHHADCWDITGMCQVPHLNS